MIKHLLLCLFCLAGVGRLAQSIPQDICKKELVTIARHSTLPRLEYPVEILASLDRECRYVVTARKDFDDQVQIHRIPSRKEISELQGKDISKETLFLKASTGRNPEIPYDELLELGIQGSPIHALAAYSDHNIVIADTEGHVDLINARTGTFLFSIDLKTHASHLLRIFPESGTVLIIAGQSAILSDAEGTFLGQLQSKLHTSFAHQSHISGSQFLSKDTLITISNDHVARLWDLSYLKQTTRPIPILSKSFTQHSAPLTALSTTKPNLIATGDREGHIFTWGPDVFKQNRRGRTAARSLHGHPLHRHQSAIESLDLSLDGRFLLSTGSDGTAFVHNTHSGALRATVDAGDYGSITRGKFIRHAQFALTTHEDGKARIWHVFPASSGRRKARLIAEYIGHDDRITDLIMLSESRFLTLSQDGTARIGVIPPLPSP